MIQTMNRIAQMAGDRILEIYNSELIETHSKDDQSPVTSADLASSELIIRELRESFDFPILCEEDDQAPYEVRRSWSKFFLVDPLDGTKDFIAKNNEFTVNIALIENGIPVAGVIGAPALGKLWFAEKGHGSFAIENGVERKIRCSSQARGTMAVSRFHDSIDTQRFGQRNNFSKTLKIGSALKFAYLAQGDVDVYPRYEGSKEWDIAAGHVILKEAGCSIVDLVTGLEPGYNKVNLRNNHFVAYSGCIPRPSLSLKELT